MVVAFGANFLDALPIDEPQQDPQLSDWLLERLGRDLAPTGAVFRKIDDDRSGEGVSVRYAFWLLDLDRVTKSIDFCWMSWPCKSIQTYLKLQPMISSTAPWCLDITRLSTVRLMVIRWGLLHVPIAVQQTSNMRTSRTARTTRFMK